MTSKRGIKTDRKLLAKASVVTVIAVLGLGLASVYSNLEHERNDGAKRTELLIQLGRDNDQLAADNAKLRALLEKQAKLLTELAQKNPNVDQKMVRDATTIPPPTTVIVRPGNGGSGGNGGNGSNGGSGGTGTKPPTVVPAPTTPPTRDPIVCVLGLCL